MKEWVATFQAGQSASIGSCIVRSTKRPLPAASIIRMVFVLKQASKKIQISVQHVRVTCFTIMGVYRNGINKLSYWDTWWCIKYVYIYIYIYIHICIYIHIYIYNKHTLPHPTPSPTTHPHPHPHTHHHVWGLMPKEWARFDAFHHHQLRQVIYTELFDLNHLI